MDKSTMTQIHFTEPCDFSIPVKALFDLNFVNERKDYETLTLIGGDVTFLGEAQLPWNPGFRVRRCNYPKIAMYMRLSSLGDWGYHAGVCCESFLDLLRLVDPDTDYLFIGTRRFNALPYKINYG